MDSRDVASRKRRYRRDSVPVNTSELSYGQFMPTAKDYDPFSPALSGGAAARRASVGAAEGIGGPPILPPHLLQVSLLVRFPVCLFFSPLITLFCGA